MFHLSLNELLGHKSDGVFQKDGFYFKVEKGVVTDIFFEKQNIVRFK